MNLKEAEYISAIASSTSLTDAAAALGITQPALTSFLKKCEAQIGTALFTRSSKKLIPTEAGRIYIDACNEMLKIKGITYHSIATMNNSITDTLTVGFTPHRGSRHFSIAYPMFYRKYPDVRLMAQEGYLLDTIEMLRQGKINFLLGSIFPAIAEEFNFTTTALDYFYLAVPAHHPLAELARYSKSPHPPVNIGNFSDTPFVLHSHKNATRWLIDSLFKEHGISPTIVFESDNVTVVKEMIASGLGVGFLPSEYCTDNERCVYYSLSPAFQNHVGIFYKKDYEPNEYERYFMYLIYKISSLEKKKSALVPDANMVKIIEEFKEAD